MMRARTMTNVAAGAALAVLLGGAATALAADYDVPSNDFPTLQSAVNDAAGNADPENTITLVVPLLTVHATITIGVEFNAGHRLTIRPSAALGRATIACDVSNVTIVSIAGLGGSDVTLQDLDIVRNTTNAQHLVVVSEYADVVIERCRIGSIWPTAGSSGWSNLEADYPYDLTVRNCIFFAVARGTFARGIHVFSLTDDSNALRLYNNVVADFGLHGIDVQASAAGALVLLRNNVVVNHPDFPATGEPFAFWSDVGPLVVVVSSHNTAFASAGRIEAGGANHQPIAGALGLLMPPRVQVDAAFVDRAWRTVPAWDSNANFYRLEPLGPLHDVSGKWGVTVTDAGPHGADFAVLNDLEGDPRPGGAPDAHTDRGADQIEPGVVLAVGDDLAAAARWAAPVATPGAAARVRFAAPAAGRLRFELFDPAGRRVRTEERAVTAGQTGVFEWSSAPATGLMLYRLTLDAERGGRSLARGKLLIVR